MHLVALQFNTCKHMSDCRLCFLNGDGDIAHLDLQTDKTYVDIFLQSSLSVDGFLMRQYIVNVFAVFDTKETATNDHQQ